MEERTSDFEDLPRDVQIRLLYESGGYDVAKDYYSDVLMKHYREPDCLKHISKYEIVKAIRDQVISIAVLNRSSSTTGFDDMMYYDTTNDSSRVRVSVSNNSRIIGQQYTVYYESVSIGSDDIIINSTGGTIVGNKIIVTYDDIFLLPSSIHKIVIRRDTSKPAKTNG